MDVKICSVHHQQWWNCSIGKMRPGTKLRVFNVLFLKEIHHLWITFCRAYVFLQKLSFQVCIVLQAAEVPGTSGSLLTCICCLQLGDHLCRLQDIKHAWFPRIFTLGMGFLSKGNPDNCHSCYAEGHFLTSMIGPGFPYFIALLQALNLCWSNSHYIWLQTNCIEAGHGLSLKSCQL